MNRVLERLSRTCVHAAQQEERLRDALLALHERTEQLNGQLCADARRLHAAPQRAAAAPEALRVLATLPAGGCSAARPWCCG